MSMFANQPSTYTEPRRVIRQLLEETAETEP